jgi:hypothetical protein
MAAGRTGSSMSRGNHREPCFRSIFFLIVFGTAMGFLEAAVVVYLREIYYPEGFAFPLKPVLLAELSIEYLREIATIIMLFSLSAVAGSNFYGRFSIFLFSFGIWDISYYLWLKVLLDWPSSFQTWDILFLIPVVWAAPVLAPLICALTMILIALSITYFRMKGYSVAITLREWVLYLMGASLVFVTFIWDYSRIIIQGGFFSRFWKLGSDAAFQNAISHHIPGSYNWYLFGLGEIMVLLSLLSFYRRIKVRRY